MGEGDDSGDNGDGGGDGGVGAEAYSAMSASVDGDGGVWCRTCILILWRRVMDTGKIVLGGGGGGVAVDSSVSKGFVSSAEGTESIAGSVSRLELDAPPPPPHPCRPWRTPPPHHHYLLH
ncbi:hypothetical protein Tco_0278828 [Tanacetum coccineum]